MLAKMWLNALSDRGHSLLNTQSTRNIYSGALPKSSNIRALMLSGSGSTSSGLSFPKYNTSTHCCSRVYQTVLKTAGVSPSIVLLGQQCFRRNTAPGITSLHGVLFQPTHGVIKWPNSGFLPFTTSGSVGNQLRKRSKPKLNKSGDKKHWRANSAKAGQRKGQQVQDNFITTKENLKCSTSNSQVESQARERINGEGRTAKVSLKYMDDADKLPTKKLGKQKINKNDTQKVQTGEEHSKASKNISNQIYEKPLQMNASRQSQAEVGEVDKSKNVKISTDGREDAVVSNKLKLTTRGQPKVTCSQKYQQVVGQMTGSRTKSEMVDTESIPSNAHQISYSKSKKADKETTVGVPQKSNMKVIVSDNPHVKKKGRPENNKGEQTGKSSLKAKNIDKKPFTVKHDQQSQAAVSGKSKRKKNKISVSAVEGAVISENSQLKETGGSKFLKANKKQLPVNAVQGSHDREEQVNQEQQLKSLLCAGGKVVVVVESAAKAKTIQKYLGDMFVVLPSYGHVRDLAGRSGSVRPDEDFSMVWEVPSTAWTHLSNIKGALTGARSLVLASDPDREGEAIAWHVTEMLKQQGSLKKNMVVARVVFHEITKSAVQSAMEMPRDISMNLVNAYLARRALDYLIGFNISPILWKKLPGCQSAGRVQSAALSLICEREKEIEEFISHEYWSVEAEACTTELCSSDRSSSFLATVSHVDGHKLEKFSINSHAAAEKVVQKVSSSKFKVLNLKRSSMRKNPPPPYITSTLQQDASNRLNFGATYTMKLAQKLYEGVKLSDNEVAGLITYMRTDGLRISEEAAESIRSLVTERYGKAYASDGIRKFHNKVKNAQEAHEAIRPTNICRLPSMLVNVLEEDALKLYTLIWCQAMACQMKQATVDQIAVSFGNEEQSVLLRSNGSAISFPGYLAVFKDGETQNARDDEVLQNIEDAKFSDLSKLKVGDPIYMGKIEALQHFTEPLPRYSEGTLVKKLEELGIGRPSTYAPILKVLQAREYVTIRSRRIFPEFRGRMVSAFLSRFFPEITDYSFTAAMESQLDDVSAGLTEWKNVLKNFWSRFHKDRERVSKVEVHQVERMLEETFGYYLFATLPGKNRVCPSCKEGTLGFKVSRHGAGYFIGCDKYPKCSYIATTMFSEEDKENENEEEQNQHYQPKVLGIDPNSDQQVLLKSGPYGSYIQLGEDKKGFTPKRANVSQIKDVGTITLEDALQLLKYPITLGQHPEDKYPVELKRTKFGFAVRHRHFIASVPKNVDHQTVTLDMAIRFLKGKDAKKVGRPSEGTSNRRPRTPKKVKQIL
eukprot:Gb_30151 [translate_table: standard]